MTETEILCSTAALIECAGRFERCVEALSEGCD